MTVSYEDLQYFYRKYRQGDTTVKQVAEVLGLTEAEVREKFNALSGVNESKQTING